MELPTQVTNTEEQPNIIQQTKTKIWQNTKVQGAYSHGPPLFPGLLTNSAAHMKQNYECDENDNVDYNNVEGETVKRERSSCMFDKSDDSNRTDGSQKHFPENYLWHKPVATEPSESDLSDLTKDFIESVMNGVKFGEGWSSESNANFPETIASKQSESSKNVSAMYSSKITNSKCLVAGPSMVAGGTVIPRKYKCDECSYSTDNRSHLRRHVSSVHCTVKQFSCYICNKEFSRQEKAKIHIVRLHPEVEYDKNKIKKGDLIKALEKTDAKKIEESKSNGSPHSSSESNRHEHINDTKGGEVTDQWEDGVDNTQPSATSKRTHRSYKELERKFRCPKCSYVGKDVWHLKRHMNEIHEGLKNFQCADCNYSTSRKHRMISHMKSHGQLRCFYCSFNSTDVNLFHSHLNECTRLHRAATYPCAVCGQPFGVRKTYAKHMMDSHGLTLYMCDECLYVSLNYSEFSRHKASHETQGLGNNDKDEAEEGEHYCAPCNELFPNEKLLQQHVDEVHSGKVLPKTAKEEDLFTCAMCDFRTIYRFVMRNHIRKHTGEKFTCDVPGCGFQAAWKNSIQHHKELKHSPVQDHVCTKCNKVFHHKLNLKLHMKIHNKSHVCPICGHAFAQLSFLNKHILKHQDDDNVNADGRKTDLFKDDDVNDNAFKCEWKGCLFRSKYRNVLKRHIDSLHHGEESPWLQMQSTTVSNEANNQQTGSMVEKCPTCGKMFDERFQLRNHMFDKHDQILQVENEVEAMA